MTGRWRWRGDVALLGVTLAFFVLPLLPSDDVINSDWPAFATGARLIVHDPSHLYDFTAQRQVELQVTGGRVLVTLGIKGILPFLAPAWVALLAVPFDLLGPNIGGRLWVLSGLACLGVGLYLATRPRPPTVMLPAFASVPTALLMLNAQLDGIVALGVGASIALWPRRRYLAGLALGLTLMKPQLVLPLGLAVILAREWRVLAGWATAGVLLLVTTLALSPRWVFDWLSQTRLTVQTGAREIDLPHLAVFLPDSLQGVGLAVLALVALGLVGWLAWRVRGHAGRAQGAFFVEEMRPAIAILIAGGVLAAPHALPADLVLVAVGLAVWDRAGWIEWLALSAGALLAALTPAPYPTLIGVVLMLGLTSRISFWQRREPAPASSR
ncbi:MAG TPA: glycosyltransferase family 87 protein [Candidatus Acidoferrum sp.]|nr:glycosyltransferase family 87 protein [Candidatus Acidoferrum sp.]